jgi:hypothetical protein
VSNWPGDESPPRARGPVAHRLGHEAAIRIARTLARPDWPDVVFAFHDDEELGPRMLARVSKRTGLRPDDL